MSTSVTVDVSEEISKIIASFELLPAQQKKEFILKIIDTAESNIVKYKEDTRSLGKIDTIKQKVLKVGKVELSFHEFGKSEISALFQILQDADATKNDRNRRIVFYALVGSYLAIFLYFFSITQTSTSIKPLITSNLVTIIAWVGVSLLYTTGYFLLNNFSEIIFKPLRRYKVKFIFNEYSISFMLSWLISTIYFIQSTSFLENKILAPLLYPLIIRTIRGILELQFGSLLTSIIGIMIFVVTTINSLLQIRLLIKDTFGKRKNDN